MNLAAQNLGDLLGVTREWLDDSVESFLWSDDELKRGINNAVREACLRARLLKDDAISRPELCRIPVRANQPRVSFRREILVPRTGRMQSGGCRLWAVTAESLDKLEPQWESDTCANTPRYMVMDLAQKTLHLYPTPAADDTLLLRVWRTPLDKELMKGARDEPVIKLPDAQELCHWACYEAFIKKDAETEDPAKAGEHLATFEARFGARPSLEEMARWADSPPRVRTGVYF